VTYSKGSLYGKWRLQHCSIAWHLRCFIAYALLYILSNKYNLILYGVSKYSLEKDLGRSTRFLICIEIVRRQLTQKRNRPTTVSIIRQINSIDEVLFNSYDLIFTWSICVPWCCSNNSKAMVLGDLFRAEVPETYIKILYSLVNSHRTYYVVYIILLYRIQFVYFFIKCTKSYRFPQIRTVSIAPT